MKRGGDYAASYVVKARYKETSQRFVDLKDWRTICRDILEIGREKVRGLLGLQVAEGSGTLPDTGGPQPLSPPVIPPLVPLSRSRLSLPLSLPLLPSLAPSRVLASRLS
jgi:hypothetical protein